MCLNSLISTALVVWSIHVGFLCDIRSHAHKMQAFLQNVGIHFGQNGIQKLCPNVPEGTTVYSYRINYYVYIMSTVVLL